jgi:hypothetical protein
MIIKQEVKLTRKEVADAILFYLDEKESSIKGPYRHEINLSNFDPTNEELCVVATITYIPPSQV